MLDRLAKLASRSSQLRKMAMKKEALLGAVVRGLGGAAIKNPLATLGTVATVGAAGSQASQKHKEFKQGFNPQSPQQQLAGAAPRPPGA